MLDPCSRPALFVLVEQLPFEAPVEFSTEETHDILGAKAQRGVPQQCLIQGPEGGAVCEHHISGELGLLNDPVVLHGFQKIIDQRIDPLGKGLQNPGPSVFDESVGQSLGALGVLDPHKAVLELAIADAISVHFAGKPLMAIEVDLDCERKKDCRI